MEQQITKLREDFRLKLKNIESGFGELKAKIVEKTQHSEQELRSQLDNVRKRIEQGQTKMAAAQSEVKHWADEQLTATSAKVAEWKAQHEMSKLQHRADKAERYAAASFELAVAAMEETEQAMLEAWLARHDAESAQQKKVA